MIEGHNRRQNCWNIFLKRGNFEEKNNLRLSLLPSLQSWCVYCFPQLEQRNNIAWRGMGEKKLYFPFLSWQNVYETLKGEVSQLVLSPMVALQAYVKKA